MTKLTHIDLFSGIGGFALAARWAGFETTAFCETDRFCRQVLRKHWPDVLKYMDIRDLAEPDHNDLMTAGFPCQPFSSAGKKRGKNDDRYLWPEVLRLIRKSQPTWFVGENVTGIVAMELDNILSDLEDEGYEATAFVIPACAANAPHRRDRVWIIANCDSNRSDSGLYRKPERCIQENGQWDVEEVQQEWSQFIPESWTDLTPGDWFQYNRKLCGRDDGLPNRMDRIKSLGNAIVPQVAYPILKNIQLIMSTRGTINPP